MKKILIITVLCCMCIVTYAQDKVVLKTGDTLTVKVTKNTEKIIEFTYPNESLINEKNKRDILCIIYASGRREEIKNVGIVVPEINSKDEWEKVIVTTNREDVEGLTKVKSIAVAAGGGIFNTVEGSKESAIKQLKKKAAKLKCGIVLITTQQFGGVYNGMNGMNMSGEAYKK